MFNISLSSHSLDSYKRIHYAPTPIMSAYLLAFAAGSYQVLTKQSQYDVSIQMIIPSCFLSFPSFFSTVTPGQFPTN